MSCAWQNPCWGGGPRRAEEKQPGIKVDEVCWESWGRGRGQAFAGERPQRRLAAKKVKVSDQILNYGGRLLMLTPSADAGLLWRLR